MSAFKAEAGLPIFDGVPEYNLGIVGENFAPGAVVLFDGEERETLRLSETMLDVKLIPIDVATPRIAEIVVNPAPGLDVSDPVLFEILPASK